MKKSAWERELSRGMDSMIGEAQEAYGANPWMDSEARHNRCEICQKERAPGQRMTEEAAIERKLGNIALRDDIIALDDQIVKLRKLAERFHDEEALRVAYRVVIDISPEKISFASTARLEDRT